MQLECFHCYLNRTVTMKGRCVCGRRLKGCNSSSVSFSHLKGVRGDVSTHQKAFVHLAEIDHRDSHAQAPLTCSIGVILIEVGLGVLLIQSSHLNLSSRILIFLYQRTHGSSAFSTIVTPV